MPKIILYVTSVKIYTGLLNVNKKKIQDIYIRPKNTVYIVWKHKYNTEKHLRGQSLNHSEIQQKVGWWWKKICCKSGVDLESCAYDVTNVGEKSEEMCKKTPDYIVAVRSQLNKGDVER